ncbi:MAG: PH domain-containing protein [Rubrivivax sp.]|nr:PH domain-containing protein [Rubrivivax sp.]
MKAVVREPAGTGRRHEHEFEPQFGLPEKLPEGERILWQGAPDWRAMALRVFHLRKLAVYFGVILALRAANALYDGGGALAAAKSVAIALPWCLLALALFAGLAWLSARTTAYTLTDRRVVMRVGIVLSLTFNLPLRRLEGAGLRLGADGVGDIPLQLLRGERIAYLHLWPHARPWQLKQPEPMLRCVPEAEAVAQRLRDAWAACTGVAAVPAAAQARASATPPTTHGHAQPALAGR